MLLFCLIIPFIPLFVLLAPFVICVHISLLFVVLPIMSLFLPFMMVLAPLDCSCDESCTPPPPLHLHKRRPPKRPCEGTMSHEWDSIKAEAVFLVGLLLDNRYLVVALVVLLVLSLGLLALTTPFMILLFPPWVGTALFSAMVFCAIVVRIVVLSLYVGPRALRLCVWIVSLCARCWLSFCDACSDLCSSLQHVPHSPTLGGGHQSGRWPSN